MDRSSRDPRSTSPRSVSRARSLSRLAAACLRVISNDDILRPKRRQDIFENYVPDNRKARCAKGKAQKCIFVLAGRTKRFCSTKHAARSTPYENKKLMSGILRRKVAIAALARSKTHRLGLSDVGRRRIRRQPSWHSGSRELRGRARDQEASLSLGASSPPSGSRNTMQRSRANFGKSARIDRRWASLSSSTGSKTVIDTFEPMLPIIRKLWTWAMTSSGISCSCLTLVRDRFDFRLSKGRAAPSMREFRGRHALGR